MSAFLQPRDPASLGIVWLEVVLHSPAPTIAKLLHLNKALQRILQIVLKNVLKIIYSFEVAEKLEVTQLLLLLAFVRPSVNEVPRAILTRQLAQLQLSNLLELRTYFEVHSADYSERTYSVICIEDAQKRVHRRVIVDSSNGYEEVLKPDPTLEAQAVQYRGYFLEYQASDFLASNSFETAKFPSWQNTSLPVLGKVTESFFSSLVKLDLTACGLQKLGSFCFKFYSLRKLILDDNQFTHFPTIVLLLGIPEISLNGNKLSPTFEPIVDLPSRQELQYTGWLLKPTLKLSLARCGLSELPEALFLIESTQAYKYLNHKVAKLTGQENLQRSLRNYNSLQELILDQNNFKHLTLPARLQRGSFKYNRLSSLDAAGNNKLAELELDLRYNRFECVPLPEAKLNLAYNPLRK